MKLLNAEMCGTQTATVGVSIDFEEMEILCSAMEEWSYHCPNKKVLEMWKQLEIAYEIMQGKLCEHSEEVARISKAIEKIDE